MTNAQQSRLEFLSDFLAFLAYFKRNQVRVTTQHKHIPMRHLHDLARVLSGKEPFHPLHADKTYEIRSQRDERRVDFMDSLAESMGLLERSDWGYIRPGPAWDVFQVSSDGQRESALTQGFWTMDWGSLYPWAEVVDLLEAHRTQLRTLLQSYPPSQKIPVAEVAEKIFPKGKERPSERERDGLFWVIIRPLEYLGLVTSHFEKDAEGFFFPESFQLRG